MVKQEDVMREFAMIFAEFKNYAKALEDESVDEVDIEDFSFDEKDEEEETINDQFIKEMEENK